MYQHLEVEYEEYASTSSSKHHGYKTEVSEGNKRVRELDDIESALAKITPRSIAAIKWQISSEGKTSRNESKI